LTPVNNYFKVSRIVLVKKRKKASPLDAFDVRYRFALNPLACVADSNARRVLREQEFPYREWRKAPVQDLKPFWSDLSVFLQDMLVVSEKVSRRFADFLVGYLLATENESPGRELRPLRTIVGSAATANPQRRESLQLVLTRAMVDDLMKEYSRKTACEVLVPQIWSAIGITLQPNSILRMERRSRRRVK
jgi:hypothetical protein